MRKPGPSLVVSLVVLGLGLAMVVPAVVVIASRTVRMLTTPAMATPGTTTRHLGAGTWVVFEYTGTRSAFSLARPGSTTLTPNDVTVAGQDGSPVPVGFPSTREILTRGSRTYTAAAAFNVVTGGDYTVRVTTPFPNEVIVARSLGETYSGIAAIVLLGGGGIVVLIVGFVLLIVGSVRRSRGRPVGGPVGGAALPPAGWYPDPSRPGRTRWWDGRQWTPYEG